jgi:hypothetical protein
LSGNQAEANWMYLLSHECVLNGDKEG